MTRYQFNLLFLEIEPDLLQPFKKGRKDLIPLKDFVLLIVLMNVEVAYFEEKSLN